jgi:hypothetical protein
VLFYPSERVALAFCIPVCLAIGYWLVRRRALYQGEGDTPDAEMAGVAAAPQIADGERGRLA